jgi:rubredoxin
MQQWKCTICGYVYDPAIGDKSNGIRPGTPFDALPQDWACPVCGAGKDMFEALKLP